MVKKRRVKTCAKHLMSHEMRLYCLCFAASLWPLAQFNTMFQGENVLIHMLNSEMLRIIKKMLGYLIPIASFTS